MKNMKNLLLAALVLVVGMTSCGDTSNHGSSIANSTKDVDINATRGAAATEASFASMDRFSLADIKDKVDVETLDAVDMNQMNAAQEDDAALLMNLQQNMLAAEKETQLLEVNFSMSDEPVDEGVFVFAIESEDEKKLTMEMYDEEGFEMAANNEFNVNAGNNYKALNVNSLENGNYIFRLKNDEGKELVRKVQIARK